MSQSPAPPQLTTERLLLRPWREEDRPLFAQMNADPRVMRYFPRLYTSEESNEMVDRIALNFEKNGFGLWAVEVTCGAPFIGFVGLAVPAFEAHFTPCVEIGWRLACDHWNQGFATEAARAALEFGFTQLGLSEIVSMTAPVNRPSRNVMEKLGMQHNPADDFDNPRVEEGSPLRRHVLYRLSREDWEASGE